MINYVLIFYTIFAAVGVCTSPGKRSKEPQYRETVVECEIKLHPASHLLDLDKIAHLSSNRLTFENREGRLIAKLVPEFKKKHSNFRGRTEFLFFPYPSISDKLVVFGVVFKEGAIFAGEGCFIRVVLPMACRIVPFRSYNAERKWISNGFLVSQGGFFARVDAGDLGYILKGGFSDIRLDGVLSYDIREGHIEISPAFKEYRSRLNPNAPEFVPMEPWKCDTALEDALSVVYVDPSADGWDSADVLLAALRTDSKKKSSQYSV